MSDLIKSRDGVLRKNTDLGDGTFAEVLATANVATAFRDAFESYSATGGKWLQNKAAGDLVLLDGNAVAASYLTISLDPLTAQTETSIESIARFSIPIEVAVGVSMSQRTLGQEFAVEIVSDENITPVPDISISSISQATTTLTVTTAAAHGLVPGKRIGIKGVSDSRLNYPSLVVASTPTATQFTATAGPGGTIPSVTAGPFTSGRVYFRPALGFAENGTSMILENATATNASFYIRTEAGDALPSGTAIGNHSVTIGTTASVQAVNAAYTYAFQPTNEYKLSLVPDRLQWTDATVDATGVSNNRVTRTQVVPDPSVEYKIRFRAANNDALTVPTAQIVSVSKSGTTTATIIFDRPHGLTTSDLIVAYGVRDQTNFANLTTATAVASVVDATTITAVWGSAVTATSYGGYAAKVNGGNLMSALGQGVVVCSTAAVSGGILTLVGNTNWASILIGDYVNAIGVRADGTGASLGVDGAYRVRNVATTTLELERIDGGAMPADFGATNAGGTVIKRTDLRISFVRVFDYERERVEMLARPSGDAAGATPVTIQNTPAVTQSGTWNVGQTAGSASAANRWFTQISDGTNSPAVKAASTAAAFTDPALVVSLNPISPANLNFPQTVTDVASAAITTTTTTSAFAPFFGTSQEITVVVTAVSGTTPTMDVGIEESDDSGTNWFRVYDFPRITANGIYRSPKMPLTGNRIRYVQTIGGTTPSFTRAINRLQSHDSTALIRQLIDRSVSLTTLNSATPSINTQGCRNAQLVINIGAATTPPALQLEGSDDNGASWYSIGTPLTAVASSTVQVTVANTQSGLLRARVSTAGVTVTAGYVLIKGF